MSLHSHSAIFIENHFGIFVEIIIFKRHIPANYRFHPRQCQSVASPGPQTPLSFPANDGYSSDPSKDVYINESHIRACVFIFTICVGVIIVIRAH